MKRLLVAAMVSLAMLSFARADEGVVEPEPSAKVSKVTIGEDVTEYADLHEALVAGSAAGSVVELLDNVDLSSVTWEPISDFKGIFDGAGYKISNLKIEKDADFAGFIGKATGNNNDLSKPAVVKNVAFENVTVLAPAQSYVAAVVAECTANVVISNVAVTGTIKIDGKKYVAAIAGHGYVAKIVDCSVDGIDNATSYIKGSDADAYQIGGIMGMTSEGENPIFGCSVKNVTISGSKIVGGIAGRSKEGTQIVGCSVQNVVLVSDATTLGAMVGQPLTEGTSVSMLLNYSQTDTVLKGTDGTTKDFAWCGEASGAIRYVYGQNAAGNALVAKSSNYALTAGDYTLQGEGALDALAAQCAANYELVDNGDGTYTIVPQVAKIGDKTYTSLEAAFADVKAGETITLLSDAEIGSTLSNTAAITLDLGGFVLARAAGASGTMLVAGDDLTITNGTINGGSQTLLNINAGTVVFGDNLYVTDAGSYFLEVYYGVLTIGAGCVVEANGCLLDAESQSVVNIYGTMRCRGEKPLIWVGCKELNVYEGADLTSGADIFRSNADATEINIYGGRMKSSDYPVFYCYSTSAAVITINGGEIAANANIGLFQLNCATASVTPLDDNCKAKFSSIIPHTWKGGKALADLCAEGYGPKKDGDWYVIAELPTVESVCIGGKGTLTVEGEGEKVAFGSKITGTVAANAGYVPFVFVDGVKVAVDPTTGAFEGVANNSAKVVATFAKEGAWYLNPFVRNEFAYGCVYSDAIGEVAIDEADFNLYFTPNRHQFVNANTGVFQFRAAQFADTFGHEWAPVIAGTRKYKTTDGMNGQENYRRLIPSYALDLLFVGKGWGDRSDNRDFTSIYPADGNWGDPNFGGTTEGAEQYLLAQSDMGNKIHQWQRIDPGVVSTDGKYMYATVYPKEQICKVNIITNENGKVTLFRPTGTDVTSVEAPTAASTLNGIRWMLATGDVPQAITIYNVNGQDVVLAATGNGKIIRLDNSGDTTLGEGDNGERGYTVLGNVGTTFRTMSVTGKEDGTPHLVCQGNNTETYVYALAVDANGVVTLASASPIAQFSAKTDIGLANNFWSLVAEDSETYAFANYRSATEKMFGGDAAMAVAIEQKPANLIVRAKFEGAEVAQPEDVTPAFGAAVEQTYTAPKGYEITAVTVNGAAVDGFTVGSTFTFSSDALNEYVLVKMTLEELPVAKIGTTTYKTLNAAFAAAKAGDTVELLRDATVADPITVADFKGTFDLSGFSVGTTFTADAYITFNGACDVVITNGTMATGTEIDIAGAAVVTVAANTTLNNAGNYGVYIYGTATLNIYGTINNTTGEMPCVWMGGSSTVNAYEGCVVNSTGDAFRVNGSGRTLNIYGGTFHGGYPIAYVYNSPNTSAINIYGGTFDSENGFVGGGAKETVVVAPLTDACKAKFSQLGSNTWFLGLDHFCATGFAPVKGEDGYYTIQKLYDITIAAAENGMVETSVTNGIVAGTEVTITVTSAETYAVDKVYTNDVELAAVEKVYSFLMPAENVEVKATFKATAKPPYEPIPAVDPAAKAAEINEGGLAAKKAVIALPEGLESVPDSYYGLFSAVPGDGVVLIELNEAGTNAVETAEQAAGTAALDAVLGTDEASAALTVVEPLAGFFYSLKQSAAIESLDFKSGDKNKLGGRDTISFTLDKAEASGFYQMIVSPTPVK